MRRVADDVAEVAHFGSEVVSTEGAAEKLTRRGDKRRGHDTVLSMSPMTARRRGEGSFGNWLGTSGIGKGFVQCLNETSAEFEEDGVKGIYLRTRKDVFVETELDK
jgi:hypothetical protein